MQAGGRVSSNMGTGNAEAAAKASPSTVANLNFLNAAVQTMRGLCSELPRVVPDHSKETGLGDCPDVVPPSLCDGITLPSKMALEYFLIAQVKKTLNIVQKCWEIILINDTQDTKLVREKLCTFFCHLVSLRPLKKSVKEINEFFVNLEKQCNPRFNLNSLKSSGFEQLIEFYCSDLSDDNANNVFSNLSELYNKEYFSLLGALDPLCRRQINSILNINEDNKQKTIKQFLLDKNKEKSTPTQIYLCQILLLLAIQKIDPNASE